MDSDTEQVLAVAELVVAQLSGASNAMALYVTVTSGYLLVAYLVGKDLTRLQAAIISVLYVVFSAFNTFAVVSYFQVAYYYGHTYGTGLVPSWPPYGMGTLFIFGILACLKFMWDVRHPKTE
jgi:hypothetical protein